MPWRTRRCWSTRRTRRRSAGRSSRGGVVRDRRRQVRCYSRARAHNGDLLVASASPDLEGVRSGGTRDRVARFGGRPRDMQAGRSLGHIVLGAAMLNGGLVGFYEQSREGSPSER